MTTVNWKGKWRSSGFHRVIFHRLVPIIPRTRISWIVSEIQLRFGTDIAVAFLRRAILSGILGANGRWENVVSRDVDWNTAASINNRWRYRQRGTVTTQSLSLVPHQNQTCVVMKFRSLLRCATLSGFGITLWVKRNLKSVRKLPSILVTYGIQLAAGQSCCCANVATHFLSVRSSSVLLRRWIFKLIVTCREESLA